jgi:hypothetical protein
MEMERALIFWIIILAFGFFGLLFIPLNKKIGRWVYRFNASFFKNRPQQLKQLRHIYKRAFSTKFQLINLAIIITTALILTTTYVLLS